MTKILITGCNGFIGAYTSEYFLKKNYEVQGVDIKLQNFIILKKYKNFKFSKISIFDHKIKNMVKNCDYIFHFAGIADPSIYIKDPKRVIDVTVNGSIKIIDLASKYKKKIIFTSTSEIYGKLNKNKFKENDNRLLGSTNIQRWCYSTSKALVEHYLLSLSKEKKLNFLCLRLFNIYGYGLESRAMSNFMNNALENKLISINGNGNTKRCYTYISDFLDGLYKSFLKFQSMKNSIYNIGSDYEISTLSLAKKIIKITGSKSKIKFINSKKNYSNGYEDIPKRIPDTNKIKSFINWNAIVNIDNGINDMLKSYDKKKNC